MKIAVFDVSHWHFPLYLSPLRDPGIEVVGISDTASFAGTRFAQQLNCKWARFGESAGLPLHSSKAPKNSPIPRSDLLPVSQPMYVAHIFSLQASFAWLHR